MKLMADVMESNAISIRNAIQDIVLIIYAHISALVILNLLVPTGAMELIVNKIQTVLQDFASISPVAEGLIARLKCKG